MKKFIFCALIFANKQTENYCEEENNLFFEKLCCFFIHIFWKSLCYLRIFQHLVLRCKVLRTFLFYLFEIQSPVLVSPSSEGENVLIWQLLLKRDRKKLLRYLYKIAKSCIYIKYLTLVRPRKLIHMNFAFFTRCKMHRTPVLLKNYSFQNFLNKSNFAFVCFCSQNIYSPQKIIMSCLCLRHGANLNSTSNVFAYFLIIFLRHDWFGVFLNK